MMHAAFRHSRVLVVLSLVVLSLVGLMVVGATAAAQSTPQPLRPPARPVRDTAMRPSAPTLPPSAGVRTVVPPPLFPSHVNVPAVPRFSTPVAPALAKSTSAMPERVALEAPRPVGATARCKDGTYLTSAPSQSECGNNGGLAVRFPAATQASSRPPVRPQ
jgi:hypothetical protein